MTKTNKELKNLISKVIESLVEESEINKKINESDILIEIKKNGQRVETKMEGNPIGAIIMLEEAKKSIAEKFDISDKQLDEILSSYVTVGKEIDDND